MRLVLAMMFGLWLLGAVHAEIITSPIAKSGTGCTVSGATEGYVYNNGSSGCSTSSTLTTNGTNDTEGGTLIIGSSGILQIPSDGLQFSGSSSGVIQIGTSYSGSTSITLSIPNPASASDTFALLGTAQTFSAAMTFSGAIKHSGITADTGLTDATVCEDTTHHQYYSGTGTAGICLGTVSSIRFKPDYTLITDGLGPIRALDPGEWHYMAGVAGSDPIKLNVGFTAERYASIDAFQPFTRYDELGQPNGVDMLAALPFAVRAIVQVDDKVEALQHLVQQQQAEIAALQAKLQ